MILWMLALMLVAAVAAAGYYQGAVRAAMSFAGLLLGVLLAMPLGNLIHPVLVMAGVTHPLLLQILGPVTVFVLINLVFMGAGFFLHFKVEHYYKHRTIDTMYLLWERLNQKVGLCVGVLNGAIGVMVLSVLIYVLGYPLVQLATPGDSFMIRMTSTLGQDLQKTGMAKAVAPFAPPKPLYYEAADVLGIIFNNPLVQNRLARYPTLVMLAETNEFKAIGEDKALQESWARQPTLGDFTANEKIKAALNNLELYTNTLAIVEPDIQDLQGFLVTGKSAKYDEEKILGRWDFDPQETMTLARKRANVTTVELRKLRKTISGSMGQANFMATLDKKAILKSPKVRYEGSWKSDGLNQYKVTLKEGKEKQEGVVLMEGSNRLLFQRDGFLWVFEK